MADKVPRVSVVMSVSNEERFLKDAVDCSRLIRERLVALSVREAGWGAIVDVSAVICTRNRHDDVVRCISSIVEQDRIPREIVVVDSSDDTLLQSTLKELFTAQTLGIALKYIRATPGLTHQRNVGIRESTGAILLFLDDDVILCNGHVREILEVFQKKPENIGGVTGNIVNLHRDSSTWNRIKRLFSVYCYGDGRFLASGAATWPNGLTELMEVEFLSGSQMAYRRQVCGEFGFDEDFFSGYSLIEDAEFSYRVSRKYRNYYCPHARCFHNTRPLSAHGTPEMYKQMLLANHAYHFHKNVPKTWLNRMAFFLSTFFIKHQDGIRAFVGFLSRVKHRLLALPVAIGTNIPRNRQQGGG